MKKIIFIIVIFLSFKNSLYADMYWEKLLHFYDKKYQIITKEFYLAGLDSTPKKEKEKFIELLNSKDYKEVACNFPLRYSYLKEMNYDIKKVNLNQCSQLNEFVSSFSKKQLSIVFSSEYTNNPSSAFGHTMILFSDGENYEIGDTVHFAAKTNNKDSFFAYSYKGFSGNYQGNFVREPFFKKIYEYNMLEQRYMHIYNLDFSQKEIKKILYHLYELRKATFKYYFLNGNCATRTTDLLNILSNKNSSNSLYYLPIDTIKEYQKHIIDKKKFIPLINKLEILIQKMNKKEKELFYKTIENNENIKEEHPDIVKEAMVYYTTFNFRRYRRIFKNYNNVMNQFFIKQNIKDSSINPLDKTQPSNIGFGYLLNNSSENLFIHYRPLFIDYQDIQSNNIQQSTVSTFNSDFIINNNTSKLLKFDFINIKSLTTQKRFYKPVSWALYSGINRLNFKNKLLFNNEFGLGLTKPFFNNYSQISYLVSLGVDDNYPFLKPSIYINQNISNNMKTGILFDYKKYEQKSYYKNEAFISFKNNDFIHTLKYIKENNKAHNSILFSIKYNF